MRDVIAMSAQELERVGVVAAVVEKRMRQREAAERLGVTQRQVKRLAARYRVAGAAGLASRRRGQPGPQGTARPGRSGRAVAPRQFALRLLAVLDGHRP